VSFERKREILIEIGKVLSQPFDPRRARTGLAVVRVLLAASQLNSEVAQLADKLSRLIEANRAAG
jgi:hypothetical protein